MVDPTREIRAADGDADDNRVLECAIAAGAGSIVTGDSHLLDLREYRGIRIIRARRALEVFEVP